MLAGCWALLVGARLADALPAQAERSAEVPAELPDGARPQKVDMQRADALGWMCALETVASGLGAPGSALASWEPTAAIHEEATSLQGAAAALDGAPAGCAEQPDDPLAPAPLCDPDAATGVVAAYVRGVADDRLEASSGCGTGELSERSWLGEHEPDPSAPRTGALEPARLPSLLEPRSRAPGSVLEPTAARGAGADGVERGVERPPMRA